ncbi:MAG TPA: hypothetical protein VF719_03935, partial [Abditibacteriaceae bacterium]
MSSSGISAPLHASTVSSIESLRAQFPDTPFLTLGQTVLWDEPVKAAFCRILEQVSPDASMMAAVHDTDYFAKLAQLEQSNEKFVMLPHNDGATRSLWSAAGELSSLFGSETVPTRHALAENGVAFDRVARGYPGGVEALLNNETQAPGWRALVHTEPHPLLATDVQLGDIAPALRAQLKWGFDESLAHLDDQTRARGEAVVTQILGWVDAYIAQNGDGTLSDLYGALTPKLWSLVRGGGSCNLQSGASTGLFRFNSSTAKLPRFRFVDLFLQPATRDIARRCYDDAVRGSGIYTLDQFGAGALPFDVVVRGHGRGTLRLDEGSLYIETEEPLTLCTGCDCGSVEELAAALEAKFGPDVVLVGKAVALISMLAAEFIFVFHEKASSYTSRTAEMNRNLRAAGIELGLHPMLRLKYATWDSLAGVEAGFQLPSHLASAFGGAHVSASDFAARWESVCDAQDALLGKLKACHAPRDLLGFLSHEESTTEFPPTSENRWAQLLREYNEARATIRAVREKTQILQTEGENSVATAKSATERAAAIERSKGENWRAEVQPLRVRLFDIKEGAAERLTAVGKLSKEERAVRAALEAEEAAAVAQLREQIAARIA